MTRFLQIHSLSSYPGALLNRDDAGFAKRLPFGGETRTRISSQCLKRHWRTFEGENALSSLHGPELQGSVRSRQSFEKFVLEPLIASKAEPALARKVVESFMDEILGKSEKKKAEDGADGAAKKSKKKGEDSAEPKPEKKEEPLHTNQVTVIGRAELSYLLNEAQKLCAQKPSEKELAEHMKKIRENFKALKKAAAGLDAALFGRMVTGDVLARGDAAVHVAHAFTVHKEHSENDYFSAVDDLLKDSGELGSGHINASELTSGLYYGYAVVDVPLLLKNLEGTSAPKDIAAKVVEKLVHLIATVSPGAKLGSTAPYSYAHCVLVEAGKSQPRTLANAFLEPVSETPNLLANSYRALGEHLADLGQMYGASNRAQVSGLGGKHLSPVLEALKLTSAVPLAGLAQWAGAQLREAV
jgi:CRISPR system Cascade subunit CasC